MHIRKYDFDYSRRFFMEKTAMGLGGAGVLTSLWSEMAESRPSVVSDGTAINMMDSFQGRAS